MLLTFPSTYLSCEKLWRLGPPSLSLTKGSLSLESSNPSLQERRTCPDVPEARAHMHVDTSSQLAVGHNTLILGSFTHRAAIYGVSTTCQALCSAADTGVFSEGNWGQSHIAFERI